jgi:hypothetical protein
MNDPTIKCPKCGAEVPLTESLAAPMVAAVRKEYEDRAALHERQHEREIETRVNDARAQETIKAQQAVQEQLAAAKATASNAEQEAEGLRAKLSEAQNAQAAAIKKERALAERERELDLTVERRVSAEVQVAASKAETAVDERYKLKLLEKDTLLESLQGKITDLQQKIEQGSQQLQGEAQEIELETTLRAKFPFDAIIEVAKGVNGADVQQQVMAPSGSYCGLILWESKRTKRWSDGWLPKLREDGRKAGADLLVIVSAALPEAVETFDCVDNVWVCSPKTALSVAVALRAALLGAHNVRQVQAGMKTKSEEVYAYVTGPQFKRRVEALVEAFTTMQEDLTAEQKAAQRQWAKRSAQIERVLTSTSGMFGDMQGIAGKALPEPEGLALTGGTE